MTLKTVAWIGLCALGLTACGDTVKRGAPGERCYPNGTCDPGLRCSDERCVADGECGDGVCDPGEDTEACPDDCGGLPSCGDGICNGDETFSSCPGDCTPRCGDGVAEGAEACDGDDLGGETCLGLGYSGGVLACASNCLTFDFGGCSATCGDGVTQGGEVCDGEDVGLSTCVDYGFAGGPLTCNADCTSVDISGCADQWCGNNIIETGEVCDGTALGGASCLDASEFNGGELGCTADCSAVDTAGCWWQECGNALREGDEACDGTDLGGQTCVSLGFTGGGTVTCDASCMIHDTSQCLASPCDGSGDCMFSCMQCAMTTLCALETMACQNSTECQDLQTCMQGCGMGNVTCINGCRNTYPVGAILMDAMYDCILCQSCPADCAGMGAVFGIACQ